MRKVMLVVTWMLVAGSAFAGPAPDSKRLALAKDYIAEEQWRRAIAELEIVVDDAKDANRDEALFWLAHSRSQIGEYAEALHTISRLERLFTRSRWVRPAHSLRVEIAQRLRRDDVLWRWAVPPPPPPAPRAATPPARTSSAGAGGSRDDAGRSGTDRRDASAATTSGADAAADRSGGAESDADADADRRAPASGAVCRRFGNADAGARQPARYA
jgi:hypothetical protein